MSDENDQEPSEATIEVAGRRWVIGGDLRADPFHATLEFWEGDTELMAVPLTPQVLTSLQAGLTGVQVAQRQAMGIVDSMAPVASVVTVTPAPGVKKSMPKMLTGWRFGLVILFGLFTVAVLILGALPSGQTP